ncbi:MAG: DUF1508 domain-containing protein [Nocardioides sp.]|uniref:YegP family protein n=1 Tax=Nocardioides sp. TaxID=35761 RepID=UPI0039E527CA
MADWIADPELTREEKIARFSALGPEPTTGPAADDGGTFEIYEERAGTFRFRLKSRNGQVIATGEARGTLSAAKKDIEAVRRAAGAAVVEVST